MTATVTSLRSGSAEWKAGKQARRTKLMSKKPNQNKSTLIQQLQRSPFHQMKPTSWSSVNRLNQSIRGPCRSQRFQTIPGINHLCHGCGIDLMVGGETNPSTHSLSLADTHNTAYRDHDQSVFKTCRHRQYITSPRKSSCMINENETVDSVLCWFMLMGELSFSQN